MSYYLKNNNTIFSDKNIAGAKKIKHLYHYETLLDPLDTVGAGGNHQWFYIKDGSRPLFDGGYNTTALIDEIKYGYMPIIQFAISSISGKYNFNDGCASYYIPYNTTPMLYDTEIIKSNDGELTPVITNVDYDKGGKVYWRMSKNNLKYFNFSVRGPTTTVCDPDTSAHNLCNSYYGLNFKTGSFVFANSTSTYMLTDNTAMFIKSNPHYVGDLNKFGFTTYDTSTFTNNTPPHFTLNINEITAKYNKLKVKIDGLYLYGNSNFTQTGASNASKDNSFVNNKASFSSNLNIPGTNQFCQALVYAITQNEEWTINNPQPGVDYLNNGTIFSNLTKATNFSTEIPVVSNTAAYSASKTFAYNDSTVKEKQSLDDINVWKHMYMKFVQDNKMYEGVQDELGECPNSAAGNTARAVFGSQVYCAEECPICSRLSPEDYTDIRPAPHTRYITCQEKIFNAGSRYLVTLCSSHLLNEKHYYTNSKWTKPIALHVSNPSKSIGIPDVTVWGVKVPVFTAVDDTEPMGFYVAANYYDSWGRIVQNITYKKGACCNGEGETLKMSGTDNPNHWITHTVEENGWRVGELEYVPYYVAGSTDRKTIKKFSDDEKIDCLFCDGDSDVLCYCCEKEDDENLKIYEDDVYANGYIKHCDCYDKINDTTLDTSKPGLGYIKPYSGNKTYYRFKFYGKNIQGNNEFDGFIDKGRLSGLSSIKLTNDTEYAYKEVNINNWENEKTQGKYGAFAWSATTKNDFTDYRTLLLGSTAKSGEQFLGDAPATTDWGSLLNKWLVYSIENNKNYDYYYFHCDSSTPVREGVKTDSTKFDVIWRGSNKDPFNNDMPQINQDFKPYGMSPSAGCNFTYSNIVLENTIDLTNKTGYLHICYPYVTVFSTNTTVDRSCGIIPNISITYEGTN